MNFLGIDPGLRSFGWAIASAHEDLIHGDLVLDLVDVGVFETMPHEDLKKSESLGIRCEEIYRHLKSLQHRFNPRGLAIEGQAFLAGRTQAQIMISLGRVRGLIDAFAVEREIEIMECSAKELKKITGKSSASKEEVAQAVERFWPRFRWPKKATIEHAADACATLIYHQDAIKRIYERNK